MPKMLSEKAERLLHITKDWFLALWIVALCLYRKYHDEWCLGIFVLFLIAYIAAVISSIFINYKRNRDFKVTLKSYRFDLLSDTFIAFFLWIYVTVIHH